MPQYEILTVPGKERVAPLDGDESLKTQEQAKIVLQQLRLQNKRDPESGHKLDYVIRRMDDNGPRASSGSSAAATSSVRISEDNRSKLARFCGSLMMETGDVIQMGEAVARLVDHFDRTKELVNPITGELNEKEILRLAREIRDRRKAEQEAAA